MRAWVGRVVGWWQRRKGGGRGVSSSAGTVDASPGHLTDPPRYTFGDQGPTLIPPRVWPQDRASDVTYIGGPNYRAPGRDRHGAVVRFCPEGVDCSACKNLRP